MKNFKRAAAILGIVVLLAVCCLPMVFAFGSGENAAGMIRASLGMVILVPVLGYAFWMVYRLVDNKKKEADSAVKNIIFDVGQVLVKYDWEGYLKGFGFPKEEYDAMAEKALELIGGNIRAFVANRSNVEAAKAMLAGSLFAGIAFSWARLGDVHAMAHPLGGFFNVPHGVANAILLPVVVDYNALADTGKYEKIYRYIAKDPEEKFTTDMLAAEIRSLTASLGIPKNLTEVGVTEDKIPAMAQDAMKSGNIAVNPRSTTQKDIENLYKKAM